MSNSMMLAMCGLGKRKYGDPNTILLLHGDSFVDASMYSAENVITNNGVQLVSGQGAFGKAFYNSGMNYFSLPATTRIKNAFLGDYTEEGVIKYTSPLDSSGNNTILSNSVNLSPLDWGYPSIIYAYGTLKSWYFFNKNDTKSIVKDLDFLINTQYHIAVVKKGNTLSLYKNGFLLSEISVASISVANITSPLYFFRYANIVYTIGYLSEYRFSNIARWTSNFTPPTQPYE